MRVGVDPRLFAPGQHLGKGSREPVSFGGQSNHSLGLSQGGCEAVDSKVSVDALGPGAVTKAREQYIPGSVVKDQTQRT